MILTYRDRYQVRTHGRGLCYELFEKRVPKRNGKVLGEAKWASLGVYPTSLAQAMRCIYKRIGLTDASELSDLRDACDRMERIERDLAAEASWTKELEEVAE